MRLGKFPDAKLSCTLLALFVTGALPAGADAADYYVSATGADAHSGTSAETPWKSLDKVNATTFQPGDRILFKSGEEWKGVLHPKGSGAKDRWITLDRYGSGAKPLFRGADKTETIDLQGQQYWIIQNLATTGGRTGVNIGSNGVNKPAVMRGIHLLNLDVSETTGGSEAAILIRPSTAAMDDVLIEDCSIRNVVASAAIWLHNTVADPVDKVDEYCTRVIIRGNRIDGASETGIIVSQTAGVLIEGNTIYRCGGYRYHGGAFAGIFPTYCRDAVIQSNEIGFTAGVPEGGDSQALSCDQFNSGAILFQYNYTHDNAGGFLLTTPEAFAKDPKGRCIVRYNISQNDGNVVSPAEGGGTFRIQGKRTTVYNNVFFNDKGTIYVQRWYGDNKGEAKFYNNIFWCPKGFDSNANNNKQGPGNPETLMYDHNVFFGNPGPKVDANQINRDPNFRKAGSGGDGFKTLNGYQIGPGSPCIGAGLKMPDNGGRDFFGNRLPEGRVDIGAHQSRAQADPPQDPGRDAKSAAALSASAVEPQPQAQEPTAPLKPNSPPDMLLPSSVQPAEHDNATQECEEIHAVNSNTWPCDRCPNPCPSRACSNWRSRGDRKSRVVHRRHPEPVRHRQLSRLQLGSGRERPVDSANGQDRHHESPDVQYRLGSGRTRRREMDLGPAR